MLEQLNNRQAEALEHAADAEDRAKQTINPRQKLDHHRLARSWRVLARAYEFQHALERFISFQKSRQVTTPSPTKSDTKTIQSHTGPQLTKKEADFIDRLARKTEAIRPVSVAALGIAIAAVLTATLLRWLSGPTVADLRFGIYIAAIMASGLLAGVPAAVGAAASSLFIVVFAFLPPYSTFKWPDAAERISLAFAALVSLIAIYFAHCGRVVLRRLYQRELANQILVNELEHRGRNMFSINQVILRKSLADDPQRADKIVGRFRAVQNANNLLAMTTTRLTIRELLAIEFAPYGESRLVARGPPVEVSPGAVRHLLLLFHELVTNAAKYGALSSSEGLVVAEWQWNGGRRVALTWTETGGPEVLNPSSKGFGSQLIDTCVQALDGHIDRSFGRNGFSCGITARIR
jgi:two-component sensor histidine kinase